MEGAPVTISVVVAVRNAAGTIERCLDSVAAQSHAAAELVVIDGASTDGTVEILAGNSDRISCWTSEPDAGVYEAWNKALERATGEWICFLGADDQLAGPDVLARMAPHLDRAVGRHRVVYGSVDVLDQDGSVVRSLGQPWQEVSGEFRQHMSLPHPATFHHRDLFRDRGWFDDRFRIAGDYEFLLREVLEREPLFIPDITVVRMAAGGMSDRPATRPRTLRESHTARHMHGLADAPAWRSFPLQKSLLHARLSSLFGPQVADRVGDAYRLVAGGRAGGAR
jgi:glycosyltransferase involved in cell wall biosynthesis